MRAIWRKWFLVATIVFVVIAPFLWFKHPLAQRRQLPDGSTLVLEKVSYGKRHVFVSDKTYRRFLSPFINLKRDPPIKLFGFYIPGPSYAAIKSQSNSIWVFLSHQTSTYVANANYWTNNFKAIAFTKTGAELGLEVSELSDSGRVILGNWKNIELYHELLGLRILQRTNETTWLKVAEFEFKNPIPVAYQK